MQNRKELLPDGDHRIAFPRNAPTRVAAVSTSSALSSQVRRACRAGALPAGQRRRAAERAELQRQAAERLASFLNVRFELTARGRVAVQEMRDAEHEDLMDALLPDSLPEYDPTAATMPAECATPAEAGRDR
jgi:hypothetical protein